MILLTIALWIIVSCIGLAAFYLVAAWVLRTLQSLEDDYDRDWWV